MHVYEHLFNRGFAAFHQHFPFQSESALLVFHVKKKKKKKKREKRKKKIKERALIARKIKFAKILYETRWEEDERHWRDDRQHLLIT
jgi:hypothetical protein